jgi:putative hemolysin
MTDSVPRKNPFRITPEGEARSFLQKFILAFRGPLEKVSGLDELANYYDKVPAGLPKHEFVTTALNELNVKVEIVGGSLSTIPPHGKVVIVANHPFGGIEGIILASLIGSVRPDFKLMANWLLGRVSEMRDYFLMVDPFGSKDSLRKNIQPMREAIQYLKNDSALGIFPSGTVSHLHLDRREVSDPDWKPTVAKLIRATESPVVPIYFEGINSTMFQLAGLIHPLLRTLLIPRELAKKKNSTVRLKIGSLIPYEKLADYETDEKLLGYLRLRTYLLADSQAKAEQENSVRKFFFSLKRPSRMEAVVRAEDSAVLRKEVDALPAVQRLVESDEHHVYYASAQQIPHVLREIGRLREITFREVHEGTGRSVDLDRFDNYYLHLFLWNHVKGEVAGGYRMGKTDKILKRFGKRGLYTNTLFDYKAPLLDQINPALELGRSFVRKEYQRSYTSLLLLWKGIGQFVVQNPRYYRLFGPVSINSEYDSLARRLIVTFLKGSSFETALGSLVKPRNPMRHRPLHGLDEELASVVVSDLEDVNGLLAVIESKQRTIPVLLRQYLKLGGKLIGFNVDANFGNVLDGLILVDLLETDPKLLDRYLGREAAEQFHAFHRALAAKNKGFFPA